jgi:hypothetical protein
LYQELGRFLKRDFDGLERKVDVGEQMVRVAQVRDEHQWFPDVAAKGTLPSATEYDLGYER